MRIAAFEDLLLVGGVVCLAVGLWLWLGLAACLIWAGVVMIAAGVRLAQVKNDGSRVDRGQGA